MTARVTRRRFCCPGYPPPRSYPGFHVGRSDFRASHSRNLSQREPMTLVSLVKARVHRFVSTGGCDLGWPQGSLLELLPHSPPILFAGSLASSFLTWIATGF